MGGHLIALVVSPLVLCAAGALAARIWPSRIPLWMCLAPAWVMAALLFGLGDIRDEIDGAVLIWFRIGSADLAVGSVALPMAALVATWLGRAADRLPMAPHRFGVMQTLVATVAILPLPMVVALIAFCDPRAWRSRRWLAGLGLATLCTATLWPWVGAVDLASLGVMLAAALGLARHPDGRRRTGWISLCAGGALLAGIRAVAPMG